MNQKETTKLSTFPEVKIKIIMASLFVVAIMILLPYSAFASNDQINNGDTVDHVTYPLLIGLASPYVGGGTYCTDASWYTDNGNSETFDISRTLFSTPGSCVTAGYTGLFRWYFATSTSNIHPETYVDSKYYEIFVTNGNYAVSTSIDTITPYNGAVVSTSTTHAIGATGYLSSVDLNSYTLLKIHVQNSNASFSQCADVICANIASSSISFDLSYPLITATGWTYSTTTGSLPIGTYYVTTSVIKGSYCFVGLCATTSTVVATSTSFTISTTTRADNIKSSVGTYLQTLSQAGDTFDGCGIASFNLLTCGQDLITYAFVPTPDALSYFGNQLHDNILTHFPLGYVTDFISILATTTVGTIPAFDVVIPAGIPGTGDHIHLDISHSMDFVLNATTSQFVTSSASSTVTFYQFTKGYWDDIMYFFALLYIISRVLGISLIHKHEVDSPANKSKNT